MTALKLHGSPKLDFVQTTIICIYKYFLCTRWNVVFCGLFWGVFLQLRLEPTFSVAQKWMILMNSCYRYNAPATPTAGPTNVVGTRTLVNALMGPPRRGIFLTAPFAMWTTKMPPIMKRPRRFPRSRATLFTVSLANFSKWWSVRSGWSERDESHRTAELMSSCVTGRNMSFPAFGSRSSVSLCKSRKQKCYHGPVCCRWRKIKSTLPSYTHTSYTHTYSEIGLCAHNIDTMPGSIVNTLGRMYVFKQKIYIIKKNPLLWPFISIASQLWLWKLEMLLVMIHNW